MIVDCHSCGATYNISDEKVRGRRVRVRCKSCSAAIIVDGETLVAEDRTRVYQPPRFDPKTEEDEPEEATRVMFASVHEYREPGPEEWMVNLSPTEQRTMSLDDIVEARNTGALKEDAFAWRDGMSDWLPIGEIAEIRAALESGEATKVVSPKNLSPALAPRGTLNGAAPGLESFRKSSSPTLPSTQIPSPPPLAPSSDSPAPAVAYSAPSAPPRAQRANEEPRKSVEYSPGSPPGVSLARLPTSPSRRAPARVREARSGDLFGGVDSAGSEDELLRSSSMPLEQYDEKPTGVRNESSVLFSLNTLKATARGPSSAPPKATLTSQPTAADILGLDASGALPGTDRNAPLYSAPMFQTPAAVLAAPEAPYRSRIDTTPPAFRSRKNAVLAAIVLGAAGIVAVFSIFFFRARYAHTAADADPGAPTVQAEAPTATPAPKPVAPDPAPMPPAAAAPAPPAPPSPVEPTATPKSSPAPAAPPTHVAAAERSTPKTAAEPARDKTADFETALRANNAPDPKRSAPSSEGPTAEKVVLAEDNSSPSDPPSKADPAPAPAIPAGPSFDTAAAKSALEAAAANALSCKSADGPTGKGKVQVTFSPSGHASAANVVGGDFAGTSVASCVARLFRMAQVPPFSGDAVTVSKSFVIPE
jgi:predicted Zn finger-like uncharacterized protein